nr:hypothetical protein [Legionella jordanis]
MKNMMGYILCLVLCFLSPVSSARILLTTKPVVLEAQGDAYLFPDSYHRNANGFHFVYVMGTYRVCHLNPLPILAHLDVLRINIELHGQRFLWNCYVYDPRFFEIDY